MPNIALLDQNTIDKIAAGEVIERPSSVVKELVENAIDAKSTAITVEIKDGGTSLIRITDNGCGIPKEETSIAFLRHSTSKIKSVQDLLSISSLGFRGEALSSIASVSQVELITKVRSSLMGVKYIIEGGIEKEIEEIGAPDGTTFLVRKLFFNTPARLKFLKSPQTEAGYINDLLEKMALSHPEISLKFINNNQTRLHTSGNANLKDLIYNIYGRDIANNLIEINAEIKGIKLHGFIGKPVISRGNRNYENYYINGRYVKSNIIAKAIEEGYKTFMMQHKYPFTVLHFEIDTGLLDINVHPTKMELRFSNNEEIYQFVMDTIKNALSHKELIPQVTIGSEKNAEQKKVLEKAPEPFEKKRLEAMLKNVHEDDKKAYEVNTKANNIKTAMMFKEATEKYQTKDKNTDLGKKTNYSESITDIQESITDKKESITDKIINNPEDKIEALSQMNLFDDRLLSKEAQYEHKIIGQVFGTYWIVQYQEKMYIIDQHAAHEKVLYERMIKELKNHEFTSQILSPPIILTLTMQEEELLKKYMDNFTRLGFEIEPFGGKEYSIRAVPANLYDLASKDILIEILDGLSENMGNTSSEMINDKIASMSCKAAVKGNMNISAAEAKELIGELLKLENPYNCPHGRPTIISMTKYEIEKKFKRIV